MLILLREAELPSVLHQQNQSHRKSLRWENQNPTEAAAVSLTYVGCGLQIQSRGKYSTDFLQLILKWPTIGKFPNFLVSSLRYVVLAPFSVEELPGLNGLKPFRSTRNWPAQMGTSVLSLNRQCKISGINEEA